jgi:hypothetical protein
MFKSTWKNSKYKTLPLEESVKVKAVPLHAMEALGGRGK